MLITYTIIKRIIDEWDPVDLLITHAPADEYDSESTGIFVRAVEMNSANIEVLANIIFEVFVENFGDDVFILGFDECIKIAKKVLADASTLCSQT